MSRSIRMTGNCLLFLLLGACPGALQATPFAIDYQERVVSYHDGSADIAVSVVSADTLPGAIKLPWGFPAVDQVSTSDTTVAAEISEEHGLRFLLVTGPSPLPQPVLVRLHVPNLRAWNAIKRADFGNMTLTHEFRNTAATEIRSYRGEFILPEGLTVTSIVSSVPAQTEKEPVAPYQIIQAGACSGLLLQSANLRTGDVASITFRCKQGDKSLVLFGCLLLIAGLYLIFYRDVLKENSNGPPASQNPKT